MHTKPTPNQPAPWLAFHDRATDLHYEWDPRWYDSHRVAVTLGGFAEPVLRHLPAPSFDGGAPFLDVLAAFYRICRDDAQASSPGADRAQAQGLARALRESAGLREEVRRLHDDQTQAEPLPDPADVALDAAARRGAADGCAAVLSDRPAWESPEDAAATIADVLLHGSSNVEPDEHEPDGWAPSWWDAYCDAFREAAEDAHLALAFEALREGLAGTLDQHAEQVRRNARIAQDAEPLPE